VTGTSPEGLPRRPALDGVRAVAVIAVMLYHARVGWVPGGFLGVDLFFVLSGFLITSLLLAEHLRWGSVDLRAFWLRRARRLLPALYVVVAVVCVWVARLPADQRPSGVAGDAEATLLYVANWRFAFSGQSYFDQFGTPSPFRHMWSLGIEEQWYVLFPLLLLALLAVLVARRPGGRWRLLPAVLMGLAFASAVLMATSYQPGTDTSRAYYGTFTRVQELLIGSVLAVLLVRRPSSPGGTWGAPLAPGSQGRMALTAVGFLAALGVVLSLVKVHDTDGWMYRGGFALVCLLTALVLASLVLVPDGLLARGLSLRPVVAVGLVSYGLYLWHWPVDVAVTPDRTHLTGSALLLARLGLAGLLATASYLLVERPVRRGALRRLPRPAGGLVAGASLAAVMAMVLVLGVVAPASVDQAAPLLPARPVGSATAARVLVVGDSVAQSLVVGFPAGEHPGIRVLASTRLGCGLGTQQIVTEGVVGLPNPTCASWPQPWQAAVERDHPDVSVLVVGPWEVLDHQVDGRTLRVGTPAYAAYLDRELTQAVRVLTATGGRVVVLDAPCFHQEPPTEPGPDLSTDRNDPARAAAVNAVVAQVAAANPATVSVAPLAALLCPGGAYTRTVDGVVARPDGVHFSAAGSALVWHWLLPRLRSPATTRPAVHAYLVGDSVPYSLRHGYTRGMVPGLAVDGTTDLGCGLLPIPVVVDGVVRDLDTGCRAWSGGWRAAVRKGLTAHPIAVGVVFLGVGEQYDRYLNGQTVPFGSAADQALIDTQLDRMVAVFRKAGAAVVLPTVPCHQIPDAGLSPDPSIINDESRIDWVNGVLRQYVAAHPAVQLYDLHGLLCAHGYTKTLDGVQLRTDGLHFTPDGARLVWQALGPALLAAAARSQGP
jgi:peptidoglycan/LPS O-acetylase OafA/YrhL